MQMNYLQIKTEIIYEVFERSLNDPAKAHFVIRKGNHSTCSYFGALSVWCLRPFYVNLATKPKSQNLMAGERDHVFFRNPQEGVVTLRQRTRNPGDQDEKEDNDEPVDYRIKQQSFAASQANFTRDRNARIARRNPFLNIPVHQDYIIIHFHNTFDTSVFSNSYRNDFGLSLVGLTELNTCAVFAIVDAVRFQRFESEISTFVNNADPALNINYNTNIRFIVDFDYLSTRKMIKNAAQQRAHVLLDIVDNVEIFQQVVRPVEQSLLDYLAQQNIEHYYDPRLHKIELVNAPVASIIEIADNFDIIQSVNSISAGIVRPGRFNIPERTFGFTVQNAGEDLPIIGVIDTGISDQNPLAPLIINDAAFDITGTSPITDEINHGTAVGALATLGTQLIPDHVGDFTADARLLPIKVLSNNNRPIPEFEVIRLIRAAHERYDVRIFTLTICYEDWKKYNEPASAYAYALDLLAYELNLLIFISIANNRDLIETDGRNSRPATYGLHFEKESANLSSPAESMNNMTVGALADNLENNTLNRISPPGNVPAIYSRTFHIDWNHPSITKVKINKRLYKPDICFYGGDYDQMLDPSHTGLKMLSCAPGMYYDRDIGTSFATPLAANLAAKIIRRYPDLAWNVQTVKALMINNAHCEKRDDLFAKLPITRQTHVAGNGLPDTESCLFSSNDRITFVLEDEIEPDKIQSYPLVLPEYLLEQDRKTGLVQVDATLCFKFDPVKNNQVAYCPLQIAFGVFKNLPLEAYELDENGDVKLVDGKQVPLGINYNTTDKYKFSPSWSQDYYYKSKMLSNTQKMSFSVSKKVLIDENRTFKIVLLSKLHKLLSVPEKTKYTTAHPFSLVVTVRENPVKGKTTGRLYNEMLLINELEAIGNIVLEGEV
ncbi:S8 family peptidase [Mucilaginibacter aquatilis]|uniref:S8 family serine peptidase n=1 Tax=Mucilaginibacter aquatilis TaxID=1517760 RepID=A0A6I4IQZ8_9SPHI|nr:S8 family peptidase [Mucilaginibacter aquatilis]MVN92663.1 S8 family serine peptidase [Mucilaginibacter aquatilis]